MSNKPQPNSDVEAHILRRYELQTKLGKGAYGIVWRAVDRKNGQMVAIKKVFDAFCNNSDAQRTFREIMFLQALKHDNIIRILNVHRADNDKDIYIVFEYMETDLHVVIKARILEEVHKQFVIYQLLKTLKYLHSAELLHRDIKPSNLLINSDCAMKVADFGLARSVATLERESAARPVLTDYIATRWYRAPEILLGSVKYTKGVDMWAVGCILGELINERAIFPGESTMNQLERIIQVTGRPSAEDLAACQSVHAETLMQNARKTVPKSFQQLCPKASPAAIDLLSKLLQFNPNRRLSAVEALNHPYVAAFHNPNDEPAAAGPITICLPDNTRYTVQEYRDKLYATLASAKRGEKAAAAPPGPTPLVSRAPAASAVAPTTVTDSAATHSPATANAAPAPAQPTSAAASAPASRPASTTPSAGVASRYQSAVLQPSGASSATSTPSTVSRQPSAVVRPTVASSSYQRATASYMSGVSRPASTSAAAVTRPVSSTWTSSGYAAAGSDGVRRTAAAPATTSAAILAASRHATAPVVVRPASRVAGATPNSTAPPAADHPL